MIDHELKQMNLFEKQQTFRPINYLGSKLRIVEKINDVINEIDPNGGRVYDLFSGSGTVAAFLGEKRPVTAVDIQEYSKVLSSAVLNEFTEDEYSKILNQLNSISNSTIFNCFKPLINYEKLSREKAESGEILDLFLFVEKSSLQSYLINESNCDVPEKLAKAIEESIENLRKQNLLDSPKTVTARYFGGVYFSIEQSIKLDILLEMANQFNERIKNVIVAATLGTASEIVNTVGKQFAQPLKTMDGKGNPKNVLTNKILKDRNLDVINIFKSNLKKYTLLARGDFAHRAIKSDYEDALTHLSKDTSVVYADPPYTRYHYSRYYHVLETMSLRDNPEITKVKYQGTTKASRGIYRVDRHQSPFSIKSKSKDAFNKLFKTVRDKNVSLILSYSPYEVGKDSTPRVRTINELMELAEKYYEEVNLVTIDGISHSKLNSMEKNFDIPIEAEVLLICINKTLGGENEIEENNTK